MIVLYAIELSIEVCGSAVAEVFNMDGDVEGTIVPVEPCLAVHHGIVVAHFLTQSFDLYLTNLYAMSLRLRQREHGQCAPVPRFRDLAEAKLISINSLEVGFELRFSKISMPHYPTFFMIRFIAQWYLLCCTTYSSVLTNEYYHMIYIYFPVSSSPVTLVCLEWKTCYSSESLTTHPSVI